MSGVKRDLEYVTQYDVILYGYGAAAEAHTHVVSALNQVPVQSAGSARVEQGGEEGLSRCLLRGRSDGSTAHKGHRDASWIVFRALVR